MSATLIEKRESSRRIDRYNLDKSILPKLGRMRLTEVTRGDVEALKARMKDVPVQANRVIALLSTLMKYALDHEWIARNPAQGVKRYKETPREVHLTRTELDRLYEVIEQSRQVAHARAIKLLVWTGARRDEVLKATWGEFDLEAGRWKRAAERNKQNKATDTPLIPPAINLLKEMKAERGSAGKEEPLFKGGRLRFFRSRVTEQAGLPDLRIHDLRHVFASVLLEGGAPIDSIALLLGHASTRMTKIYANRSADNLKQIADMASANLAPRALPAPRARRKAA